MSSTSNGESSLLEVPGAPIIIPPPEIRAIVDKTSLFVVTKGGLELEAKIRERNSGDPKFAFLNPTDPYNRYYLLKLDEARSGRQGKLINLLFQMGKFPGDDDNVTSKRESVS